MDILPIWTSHYSGRSILTLEKNHPKCGARSLLQLAKENSLKDVFLIENCMTGFLEAYSNAKDLELNLRFGLKLTITDDATPKEDSLKNESKVILFMKNSEAYKDIIKIWAWANEVGFYYIPRIDWKNFSNLITKNISVAFPFYDSFVAQNALEFSDIVPQLNNVDYTFFSESHGLPFDHIIKDALAGYCKSENGCDIVDTHSIFYEKNNDFLAYQTFRCILNKTKLNKPEFSYMSVDNFSLEAWRQLNGKKN